MTAPVTRHARPHHAPQDQGRQRRRFLAVLSGAAVGCAVLAVVLSSDLDQSARQAASSLGLVLSGAFTAVSCGRRSRFTIGRRRQSWLLLTAAALVAISGNLWAVLSGAAGEASSKTVSDVTITVALILCIAAVLGFPSARRRGIDLIIVIVDGLIIGGAVLIAASVLVYAELLDTSDTFSSRAATLLIPVLDVALVVAVLLLLLRSRGSDRLALGLLALGFLAYVLSDLPFAVLDATNDFEFGTPLDLGWVVGYTLIGLAAWFPSTEVDLADGLDTTSEVRDTALVYLVLMIAAGVQVLAGNGEHLTAPAVGLWLVLALAAGTRQMLLTHDNHRLRRGLEREVQDRTDDLRRLVHRTEILLTSVGDGIYGVDSDGRITSMNPSGARALGADVEAFLGQHAHDAFHAPTADGTPYPVEGCYITDAVRSGLVVSAEEDSYVRSDGTTFPVEITASPIVDGADIRGAVVVFRDVTQRREVDRMKNEFLSVVSHELRTPLTSIRGSLDLLASGVLGDLTPRAQAMAQIAVESSERLTRLINDILDLERIESGSRPMNTVPIDAVDLLTRSATEMTGLSRSSGVGIEVRPSTGRVRADPDRIVQTLTNLIGNAIKFSDRGTVVSCDATELDGEVLFRVCDQGRGIPEDKLETIFQRFEQVDSSDARTKGGTGLGLAISLGIVERHGGRIWAESEPGAGTTVLFTLPSATSDPGARNAHAPGGSRFVAPGPHPVLLVEDDDDLAEVLSAIAESCSMPLVRAAGAREAIRLAAEVTPRLVVLDVELADGDGYDVVAALRRDARTAETDLVVYSAADVDPADRPRLTLGHTEFVTKGRVDPGELEERVTALLRAQHTRGRTTA